MPGTQVQVPVVRAVDGDTVKVEVDGSTENLRILALDTEESHAGGGKPVTDWGRAAKARAEQVFHAGDVITLEFPGNEPPDVCWQRYRGNYGRPLVFVFLDSGDDYQELMIREGYSPYFNKYGDAAFAANRARYVAAERDAQIAHAGVWDQLRVNGSEIRNYASLGTWWNLRATIIDGYRAHVAQAPGSVLNTRLDFGQLQQKAQSRDNAIVFTELRDLTMIGSRHGKISIGSIQQPFEVFIPDIDDTAGQEIVQLLETRYLPGDLDHPRRSYAYLSGPLHVYRGRPQITITDPAQVSDTP